MKNYILKAISHLVLIIFSLIIILPLLWILRNSFTNKLNAYKIPPEFSPIILDNYIEIYIKSELNKIIRLKKKKIYHSKKKQKIVGLNIKPEFPKNPDITIVNNFKKSIDGISKELLRDIKKKY